MAHLTAYTEVSNQAIKMQNKNYKTHSVCFSCHMRKCIYKISFCLGMRGNEIDCYLDRVNLVSFVVRNFKPEFFLQSHHNLYCIQAVKAKIFLEVGTRVYLTKHFTKGNWSIHTHFIDPESRYRTFDTTD
jgi:hypothetical protein